MAMFSSIKHCIKILPEMQLEWYCTCDNNPDGCDKSNHQMKIIDNCKYYQKRLFIG